MSLKKKGKKDNMTHAYSIGLVRRFLQMTIMILLMTNRCNEAPTENKCIHLLTFFVFCSLKIEQLKLQMVHTVTKIMQRQ